MEKQEDSICVWIIIKKLAEMTFLKIISHLCTVNGIVPFTNKVLTVSKLRLLRTVCTVKLPVFNFFFYTGARCVIMGCAGIPTPLLYIYTFFIKSTVLLFTKLVNPYKQRWFECEQYIKNYCHTLYTLYTLKTQRYA